MNFDNLSNEIIKYIGGEENILGLTHCATRLRFTLKDDGVADKDKIKAIKGVLGVAQNGGQFQIIIGNEVSKAYASINSKLHISDTSTTQPENVKLTEKLFDFIASIFTPILPAIIGAGLVKSVLALAVLLGLSTQSNTYYFINIIGDAPLYFLPMMLAVTASKKLGCNPYMAFAITGALLHPNYTALITDAYNIHFSSMFGIPVTLASYGSCVIPVLLMVFLLKYVDRFLDRIIPKMIKFFFKPLLTLLIVASITFIILGPIGFVVGVGISTALNFLSEHVGWLVPMIIGAIFPLMVTTGMHYGIVPFMIQSIGAQGFEQICGPGNLPSNIAQGAASLAVAFKTKKEDLKQIALSSGLTAVLGVTEPALFSVTLKYKKVLACVMIGGSLGGLYAGIMDVKCFSFCSPGLLSMVAYIGNDGWGNLINACISMVIAFVATFILVWTWGYQDAKESNEKEIIISCPVKGKVVPLSEVPDETFSQEMLGKGVAIIPEQNQFYAPASGEVSVVFPTGHAIGLTSEDGTELLIHIGLDTVQLNGEGFHVKVQQGQKIKQGDLLVEVDLDAIKEKGYSVITPILVTNPDQYQEIEKLKMGSSEAKEELLKLRS